VSCNLEKYLILLLISSIKVAVDFLAIDFVLLVFHFAVQVCKKLQISCKIFFWKLIANHTIISKRVVVISQSQTNLNNNYYHLPGKNRQKSAILNKIGSSFLC